MQHCGSTYNIAWSRGVLEGIENKAKELELMAKGEEFPCNTEILDNSRADGKNFTRKR